MIPLNEGLPQVPFSEMARHGIMKTNDAEDVVYGEHSAYHDTMIRSTRDKKPYKTLTGRQQFYIDHDWFLDEGEALPGYREPLEVEGYPMRLLMGHARHGIHSMWRDDPLLVSLQRGEPDIYVNPVDAGGRDVEDGDLIRVFNSFGSFVAMAHVTSAMQPGMTFMYHGWDPMMFRGRKNFGAVIPTSGLIKPTSVAFGYGHITYRSLAFEPNLTLADFTCDYEKYDS
jgi:nitrate reductase alpha subunit